MKPQVSIESVSVSRPPLVIGLHLDLKYVMPRKEYLLRWLDEIAALGINTLLLEYEDKFPWARYPFLRSQEAWTPDELRHFLQKARGLGLRIVPLVQTLSHLEFALAHSGLAHLREMPDIHTQINPSSHEAIAFIDGLIEEVLAYHEADEWFHIGADEAWFLGTNPAYASEVAALGAPAYWARHTRRLAERLIARGKRPVVWDDVLWHGLPQAAVPEFPQETILASWEYAARGYEPGMFPHVDVFRGAGFDVLGAPCLSEGVLHPDHEQALGNAEAWAGKARSANLLGVINTSWACHHTPLPMQMPYVAAAAAMLAEERVEIDEAWMNDLLRRYFGVPCDEIACALSQLGANYKQNCGLRKPITPVLYSCMDMILGYEGGQDERARRGDYPLDWDDVDFASIAHQKMELLRQTPHPDALRATLERLQSGYEHAESVLSSLSQLR
jgi:hypothetical protein